MAMTSDSPVALKMQDPTLQDQTMTDLTLTDFLLPHLSCFVGQAVNDPAFAVGLSGFMPPSVI